MTNWDDSSTQGYLAPLILCAASKDDEICSLSHSKGYNQLEILNVKDSANTHMQCNKLLLGECNN